MVPMVCVSGSGGGGVGTGTTYVVAVGSYTLGCDVAGCCEDAGGDGCLYYWGGHGCYEVIGYGGEIIEGRDGIYVEGKGQHNKLREGFRSLALVAAADWARTS
jgi:hypothetical protein